jgi:hypothetical protein
MQASCTPFAEAIKQPSAPLAKLSTVPRRMALPALMLSGSVVSLGVGEEASDHVCILCRVQGTIGHTL